MYNFAKDQYAEYDHIFLPGEVHGAEDVVYILWYNPDADCVDGVSVPNTAILNIYDQVNGNPEQFFDEIYSVDDPSIRAFGYYDYSAVVESFPNADFIIGPDGGLPDAMTFLVDWAEN